jgi:tetratricopeptide (TPR) repeat protein
MADLSTQFDLIVERVGLFNRLGDRVSQLKDLDSLEKLAQQIGDNNRLAKMLMSRTLYDYLTGNYTGAIEDASQAEALSDSIAETDLAFLAQTTWFLALLRLGRLEESMQRAQNTLKRVRRVGNRKEEARVLNAMGMIALEQKDPDAHHYLVEALRIAREIKDRGLEHRALNNLAMWEGAVDGDYATAQDYYQQSYNIARENGDRNAEGITLANLGFAAGIQGDFVAAQRYHEQSLSLAREIGSRYQEAYVLINLSAVAGIQNDSLLALHYAQEALGLAQKVGERSGEAWAMLYMGHAYLLMNELEQARQTYQKSTEIREALGQPSLSMEPLAGLVEVALRMDDLEAAARGADKILAYLDNGGTLNGTDEPLRVYYTCYLLLQKKQDPRSSQILQIAAQLLESQVSKFKDEPSRKMYIENVPWRLAIQRASQGYPDGLRS